MAEMQGQRPMPGRGRRHATYATLSQPHAPRLQCLQWCTPCHSPFPRPFRVPFSPPHRPTRTHARTQPTPPLPVSCGGRTCFELHKEVPPLPTPHPLPGLSIKPGLKSLGIQKKPHETQGSASSANGGRTC